MPASAFAQGRLDARYVATLGGIQLGEGAWIIDVGDDQFTAAASGMTTGLARFFAPGRGTGASRGAIKNGDFSPASYSTTMTTGRQHQRCAHHVSPADT